MSAPAASSLDLKFGTRTVTLETGRIARQANASVWVRSDDDVVLVTVTASKEPRPGVDFFPLVVEYREKLASGGRIPGSFNRREGRISDAEVLACRKIDRSVRPLFPDGFRCEVQVQATVFSSSPAGDCESLALLGAGAALHLSDVPFDGPVAGVRSVLYRDRTTLLPVAAEREDTTAELMVAVGPHGLVMVEGEAKEVPDDRMLDHLLATVDALETVRDKLEEWRNESGRDKREFAVEGPDPAHVARLAEACENELREAVTIRVKADRNDALGRILDDYRTSFVGADGTVDADRAAEHAAAGELFWKLQKRLVRQNATERGVRIDGRGPTDVRPIWGEHRLLPRAHGSALFTRGETQALATCTLGNDRDVQRVERPTGQTEHRFLLHYNFPPFSVGEVRPLRGPGRREIGHGNLAHRALAQVLPDYETFPYTIRIESDILESNGSSSMATACSGCLALMDAGVPIARPVAGIAMGLIAEESEVAVLSDILGDEDHLGDMDFKITGTAQGITALQMDNKIGGLTREVLARAVAQAREGIDHILAEMAKILAGTAKKLSQHAPQVHTVRIQPHLIRKLIGPRGETIKGLQESTGAGVSVDDTGLVTVYAPEGRAADRALDAIKQIAGEVFVGETYRGTVSNTAPFGVFVKIYESAEGLVEKERFRGPMPAQGASLEVRVLGVDGRGRIQLEPA